MRASGSPELLTRDCSNEDANVAHQQSSFVSISTDLPLDRKAVEQMFQQRFTCFTSACVDTHCYLTPETDVFADVDITVWLGGRARPQSDHTRRNGLRPTPGPGGS